MRFMMIVRPQFPIPPEMVGGVVEGFASWWEQYRGRWESAGFYAGGGGGGGICNVTDENEFHRMIVEWPLTPFAEIEAHALIDMDVALTTWREVVAAVAMEQGASKGGS